MTALTAASLGGLISFLSTSAGAVGGRFSIGLRSSSRWSLSIDFALGLMVSAVAFSLVGPAAMDAGSGHLFPILAAAALGMAFVWIAKLSIRAGEHASARATNHLLLASVLMLHNFPEGLASGAALAGLGWDGSAAILGGIALQNVPEGALMVMCLRAIGWNESKALLGGLGSGAVELAGGVLAGVLLQSLDGTLPFLLSFAGGAMMTSVLAELLEGEKPFSERILSVQFGAGFAILPALQWVTG